MDFSLEFNEFYYGKDDFDQKSLMKGLDLVTSRLYTKRDPDELVWGKIISEFTPFHPAGASYS